MGALDLVLVVTAVGASAAFVFWKLVLARAKGPKVVVKGALAKAGKKR